MRTSFIVAFALLASACTKKNPDLCCTTQADCDSVGIPIGSGCVDGLVCRGNQCIAETCSSSAECDAAAPFCNGESCIETCSSDTQCPGFAGDGTTPYCVNGVCVGCRGGADCPSSLSVCDANTCRGCIANSECDSDLCDTASGACISEAEIVYASPTGTTSGPCTKSSPCELGFAIASATSQRATVKLAPGTYPTNSNTRLSITMTDGLTVTLVGDQSAVNLGVFLRAGGLRLRDLTLTQPVYQSFVDCSPMVAGGPMPTVELDHVTFYNSYVTGHPCTVKMTAVTAHGDPSVSTGSSFATMQGESTPAVRGSALTIDGSRFDAIYLGIFSHSTVNVKNSIFTNTGTYGVINYNTLDNSGSSSVEFSTFYDATLNCASGTNTIAFRNNAIVNNAAGAPADTVTGPGCSHGYELIAPQSTSLIGAAGIQLNTDPQFISPLAGDFHLQPTSPAIDAADPTATLNSDFDGSIRPKGSGRDLGAFESH